MPPDLPSPPVAPQAVRWANGWPLVTALAFGQLVSWGTIYYAFSLFVVPMEQELGWTRTELNGALSLGLLVAGFCAYPVGASIDKRGGRLLMSAGSAIASVLLAAWSQVQSLPAFYVLWAGLGACMALTLYEPVFAVLTRLFDRDARFRITMLTLVGGFASTVFMPLTAWFIATLGWRDALLALGLCNLLYALPVHLFWLRDGAPKALAPAMQAEQAGAQPGVMRRAFASPVFWGLVVCFTFYYATFSALTFHLIPLFAERGFALALAVGVIAVIGPAQVAGRVLILLLGRHAGAGETGRVVVVLFPISVAVLIAWPESLAAAFVFAAIYGTGNGIMTIVRGTAVPDLMWREGYGAINGALTLPANIAKAFAPLAAALIWAIGEGYGAVLWAVLGGSLVSAAGFWFAALKARPE